MKINKIKICILLSGLFLLGCNKVLDLQPTDQLSANVIFGDPKGVEIYMANLYTNRSSNIRKTFLLMTVFLVLLIALGYGLSAYFGNPNILYIAVVLSVGMNFVDCQDLPVNAMCLPKQSRKRAKACLRGAKWGPCIRSAWM